MRPKNVDDIYPLTPMQKLMLMHSSQMTGSYVLANQFQYNLTGHVDPSRLQSCLTALHRRHPALRSFFLWEGLREPVQLVHSDPILDFEFVEVPERLNGSRTDTLTKIADKDKEREFDLTRPTLSRYVLIRLAAEEFRLIWSRHHLILDRWCVDVLFDELFALYDSDDPVIPDRRAASPGFKLYLAWIRQQDKSQAIDYWKNTLGDLEFPTLVSQKQSRTTSMAAGMPALEKRLGSSLSDSLGTFAKSTGVSLAVVMQGALAILLGNRCGREDALFGLTVSGRPSDLIGVESMMGSFINNVPVRVPIRTKMSLAEWLREIQSAQASRMPYEYVSLADIRGVMSLPAGSPPFDVLALFHSPTVESRRGRSFTLEQLPGVFESAYPLTLSLAGSAADLCIAAAHDPGRMDKDSVKAILAELDSILSMFVGRPDSTVGEFRETPPTGDHRVAEPRVAASRSRVVEEQLDGNAAVLAGIWTRVLGVENVGLDDDFFALGGTSLQAVEAFNEIEKQFGQVLPLSVLFSAGSIRGLLEALETPERSHRTLVEIQPRGDNPPLLVIPGVGGDTVALASLARVLGPTQPFYGFQSLGLDGQSRPLTTIEEIATANIAEMETIKNKPYILCGICWGAAVALEMAQRLDDLGTAPQMLIVVDPAYREENLVNSVTKDPSFATLRFISSRLKGYVSEFSSMDTDRRRVWMREKAGLIYSRLRGRDLFGGNRAEIGRERVLSANIKAQLGHDPSPYNGMIHAVLTKDRDIGESDPRFEWLHRVAPDRPVNYVPGSTTGDLLSGANAVVLATEISRLIGGGPENV